MNHNNKLIMVRAMKAHGGIFVRALAECFLLADQFNVIKLVDACPEYVNKYGPGSAMYAATMEASADA